MAEEETPISKITPSGFMEVETPSGDGENTNNTTPPPIMGPEEQHPKRISDKDLWDVRSRLQYSSRDTLDTSNKSTLNSDTMGSLFSVSASGTSSNPNRSLFSGSGTSSNPNNTTTIGMPPPRNTPPTSLLSSLPFFATSVPVTPTPPTSLPLGNDPITPTEQSIPSSSGTGTITVQENQLVELLKLIGETSQPPPQTQPPPHAPMGTTQPNQDWLSQLMNVLKPAPSPPIPPPTPKLGAVESLMALMVEQLKKQQPLPEPTPPPNPARELLKMLKVLSEEEPGLQGRAVSIPKSAVKSRFCDWIAEYPFPDGQKVPLVVGTYDGTRDPEDHLALYDQAILTEKWVDPVACHLFPGTLQGHARDWFTGLPERSIRDFQDLKEKFTAHFFQ